MPTYPNRPTTNRTNTWSDSVKLPDTVDTRRYRDHDVSRVAKLARQRRQMNGLSGGRVPEQCKRLLETLVWCTLPSLLLQLQIILLVDFDPRQCWSVRAEARTCRRCNTYSVPLCPNCNAVILTLYLSVPTVMPSYLLCTSLSQL